MFIVANRYSWDLGLAAANYIPAGSDQMNPVAKGRREGAAWPRCGSFAIIGYPLWVSAPLIIQLLLPISSSCRGQAKFEGRFPLCLKNPLQFLLGFKEQNQAISSYSFSLSIFSITRGFATD